MAHRSTLTIANIRFTIDCDSQVEDLRRQDAYGAFVSSAPERVDVDVPVTLIPRPLTGLSRLIRCFDGEDVWSLFKDGDIRTLAHMGWGVENPIWAAEFPLDCSSVRIHCGGVLLKEIDGEVRLSTPMRYPLDQLLMTYVLSQRDGLLVHCAGVVCSEKLWLLAGKSGAGKSTASELLAHYPGLTLLSDDRIVVRSCENGFAGFGTPWPGESRIAANQKAPLAGILFLDQSPENCITPMGPMEGLEKLLPVSSVPWYERDLFPEVIDFCGRIVEELPLYRLQFRPDSEAAEMLVAFMSG